MIPLLQVQYDFFEEPDPTLTYVFIGIFAAVIAIAIIGSLVTNKQKKTPSSNKTKFNKFSFRRRAHKIGLNNQHFDILENMISRYQIRNPDRLLYNSPLLASTMKRMIADIDASENIEAVKEQMKYLLFQLKRIIENNSKSTLSLSSTKQLRKGQEVRISPQGGPSYETTVHSKLQNILGLNVPEDRIGQEIRWKKGTRLHVSAIIDINRVFSFNTKVVGYNAHRGESILFVEHAQNIKQNQKRRSLRKDLDRPCYFYPVEIMTVPEGKKQVRKAMINQNRRHLGTMVDVSAGGCCIKTKAALKSGSLIKIEFEPRRRIPITVFGKVRAYDPAPPLGGFMHIMFTRISKRNLNIIQEYVYDIDLEHAAY